MILKVQKKLKQQWIARKKIFSFYNRKYLGKETKYAVKSFI